MKEKNLVQMDYFHPRKKLKFIPYFNVKTDIIVGHQSGQSAR